MIYKIFLDTNDHNGALEDCQYERYSLNTESGFNMDHHKVHTMKQAVLLY